MFTLHVLRVISSVHLHRHSGNLQQQLMANIVIPVSTTCLCKHIHMSHRNLINEKDRERGNRLKIASVKAQRGMEDVWDFLPEEIEAASADEQVDTTPKDDGGISVYGGSICMPGPETDEKLFGGIKYKDLPTVHIKAGWNNTLVIITTRDRGGRRKAVSQTSCGMIGFRNAKKSTNIAGQSTGLDAAMRCLKNGIKHVRVAIKGIGPGRMAAVKGLQMGGVNIVSISDHSIYNTGLRPPRPRSV